MAKVETFVQHPAKADVSVQQIFPWYNELEQLMLASGAVSREDASQLRGIWQSDISRRRIVSEFLKDPVLGKKRLASMPDRMTNTISSSSGQTLYRPTAINCYPSRFTSLDDWWAQWKQFMFLQEVRPGVKVVGLLKKIPRAKYPALTAQEEELSVGLQIVYQAVFDGIIMSMLDTVGRDRSGRDVWQDIRRQIARALNQDKTRRVMEILFRTYGEADVMCLQEVAGGFAASLDQEPTVTSLFLAVFPASARDRDQNSVVLLRKSVFVEAREVSGQAQALIQGKAPLDDGDLLVVKAKVREAGGRAAGRVGSTDARPHLAADDARTSMARRI
jgi:hypothetical protein